MDQREGFAPKVGLEPENEMDYVWNHKRWPVITIVSLAYTLVMLYTLINKILCVLALINLKLRILYSKSTSKRNRCATNLFTIHLNATITGRKNFGGKLLPASPNSAY